MAPTKVGPNGPSISLDHKGSCQHGARSTDHGTDRVLGRLSGFGRRSLGSGVVFEREMIAVLLILVGEEPHLQTHGEENGPGASTVLSFEPFTALLWQISGWKEGTIQPMPNQLHIDSASWLKQRL